MVCDGWVMLKVEEEVFFEVIDLVDIYFGKDINLMVDDGLIIVLIGDDFIVVVMKKVSLCLGVV